jgi:hypothetical protein
MNENGTLEYQLTFNETSFCGKNYIYEHGGRLEVKICIIFELMDRALIQMN